MSMRYVGRFAPSPTGPLHKGSLVTALAAYLDARAHDGLFIIRIEDTDHFRCRPEFAQSILEDLDGLHMSSDAPVWFQSARASVYHDYLAGLLNRGLAYPCSCTNADIEGANQRLGVTSRRYPGTCRQGACGPVRSYRFKTEDTVIRFSDRNAGSFEENVFRETGDFVLKRADGPYSYQFACVVDDALSGVTDIVRGMDILPSTPRQIALYRALSFPLARYLHVPLVLDAEGRKLSKQNGAPSISKDYLAELEDAFVRLGFPRIGADSIDSFYKRAAALWKERVPM